MWNVTASAGHCLRTCATFLRKAHPSEDHSLVKIAPFGDVHESMGTNIQSGACESGLAHPQYVESFDASVGLDEHVVVGVVTDEIDACSTSQYGPCHRLEWLNRERQGRGCPPMVQDRHQEVRARRRTVTFEYLFDRVVRLVGKQICDRRRI